MIDEIRKRWAATTPGPWHACELSMRGASVVCAGGWQVCACEAQRNEQCVADAEAIAHAPADVASLLENVARLTRERDEARAKLAKVLRETTGGGK